MGRAEGRRGAAAGRGWGPRTRVPLPPPLRPPPLVLQKLDADVEASRGVHMQVMHNDTLLHEDTVPLETVQLLR